MHREAGAPLAAIHMAGDEVPHGSWEKSPTANASMQNRPEISRTKDLWRFYFNKIKTMLQNKDLGYTLDGSEPNSESRIFSETIDSKGTIKLSAFDTRGRKGKTITVANQ